MFHLAEAVLIQRLGRKATQQGRRAEAVALPQQRHFAVFAVAPREAREREQLRRNLTRQHVLDDQLLQRASEPLLGCRAPALALLELWLLLPRLRVLLSAERGLWTRLGSDQEQEGHEARRRLERFRGRYWSA